jgi:hypothetical protein
MAAFNSRFAVAPTEKVDGRISIRYGPHRIAQDAQDQLPPRRHANVARQGREEFARR